MAKDFFRNKTEFNFQLSIIDFHRLKSKTSGCRLGQIALRNFIVEAVKTKMLSERVETCQ